MKLVCFLVLSFFVAGVAALENDVDSKCEGLLKIIGDVGSEPIQTLYAYKNGGHWRTSDIHRGIFYTLEPKDMVRYDFSWTITKPRLREETMSDGSLACEIPMSWQLSLHPPTTVVFPPIAHGQRQDLPLYEVTTFAGIYLAKSKFPTVVPDHVRVLWHLSESDIPTDVATEILAGYKHINNNVAIVKDIMDRSNEVQLIALHISNKEDILQGNQYWLIANADAHRSILDGIYETPLSKHNLWLPWFKAGQLEWNSKTPVEAYETTVLAGTDSASVFDHQRSQFLPEPILGQNRSQMVYDAIAPSVYAFIDELEPLFAHLLLKQPYGYKFLTFSISRNGEFELRKAESIADPAHLGLPSAQELGFAHAMDITASLKLIEHSLACPALLYFICSSLK
ncbi:MAG TPA: hypothetical protein VEL47_01695 [Myxococcota bacterium]|nr:hypothetical protein [Myxococcota bacterium]